MELDSKLGNFFSCAKPSSIYFLMIVTPTAASSFLVSETVPWAQRWIRCAGHQARSRPWEGRETRGNFLPRPPFCPLNPVPSSLSLTAVQARTCTQHPFASHRGPPWEGMAEPMWQLWRWQRRGGKSKPPPLLWSVPPLLCWELTAAPLDVTPVLGGCGAGEVEMSVSWALAARDAARQAPTASSSSRSNCCCCRAQQLQRKREGKPSASACEACLQVAAGGGGTEES